MIIEAQSWSFRIGTVGDTGNARGKPYHLHDAIMTMVPYPWRIDAGVQGWRKMFYLNPIKYLNMILSTYSYMAPEAYGVMAAIESRARKEPETEIRKKTAVAYAKYQKISVKSAEHTFIR